MPRNVMYFLSIKKKAKCIIQNLLIPEFIFAVYLEMLQKHFLPFSPLTCFPYCLSQWQINASVSVTLTDEFVCQ